MILFLLIMSTVDFAIHHTDFPSIKDLWPQLLKVLMAEIFLLSEIFRDCPNLAQGCTASWAGPHPTTK